MRTFGSIAVALDKTRHSKFQAKGKEYKLVGYSLVSKAYRLYEKEAREVIEKRDVLFEESTTTNFPLNTDEASHFTGTTSLLKRVKMQPDHFEKEEILSEEFQSAEEAESEPEDMPTEFQNDDENREADEHQMEDVRIGPGRPKLVRTGKPGRPRKHYNVLNFVATQEFLLPGTY
ncbi:hypothetical protein KR084_000675, partial [Drosophila pseudotakahashii]